MSYSRKPSCHRCTRGGGGRGGWRGESHVPLQKTLKNWIIKMTENIKIEDPLQDFLTTPSTPLKRILKWLCIYIFKTNTIGDKSIFLCQIVTLSSRGRQVFSHPAPSKRKDDAQNRTSHRWVNKKRGGRNVEWHFGKKNNSITSSKVRSLRQKQDRKSKTTYGVFWLLSLLD